VQKRLERRGVKNTLFEKQEVIDQNQPKLILPDGLPKLLNAKHFVVLEPSLALGTT
jgi:hypothetical protein